jgi:hypothetical protein
MPSDQSYFDDPVFELAPAGNYRAQIKKVEEKTPLGGGKNYISLTCEITEPGEYHGRPFWHSLFTFADNEIAKGRAYGQLALLADACSVTMPTANVKLKDVERLYAREFVASLDIRPARGTYKAQNVLRAARPLSLSSPSASPLPNDDIPY